MTKIVQIAATSETRDFSGVLFALTDTGRILIGTQVGALVEWQEDVTPSQELIDQLARENPKP